MKRSIYLQPTAVFWSRAERRPIDQPDIPEWRGLPLAGGQLSFAALDVLTRGSPNTTRRTIVLGDAFSGDWGREALAAADILQELSEQRPRFAGMSLDRPRIMGIVNVTPDSFSDGGQFSSTEAAIAHGLKLVEHGADILDIGGESTRPKSDAVAVDDELRRVIPVIEGLRARTDAVISVDTRKSEVMKRAAEAGADILNDVSAFTHDPEALSVAVETGLPVILMHAQGDPKTMNDDPKYDDVVLDVFDYLEGRIQACVAAGIPKTKIVADPGIGFGKHLHHNVAVMAGLSLYHGLGVALLLGASRKKMIGELCDVADAKDRVPGSLACAIAGVGAGVQIVRVHDVKETKQAIAVWRACMAGTEKGLD
ncbi:dihydropteroate synthase [Hyphomicrobium methylovorum]|uniref:dihydropteroate synthase n=1 Tax=Hyphomicrobium methylovorum TaxID=84 RepID=UPI0015E733A9|nr:dihydropteroate synthase [Hyphomicrobium methylovorum]MBA2127073.1 dihydropteroate synthase [Hyphomicrobium methylovorum]